MGWWYLHAEGPRHSPCGWCGSRRADAALGQILHGVSHFLTALTLAARFPRTTIQHAEKAPSGPWSRSVAPHNPKIIKQRFDALGSRCYGVLSKRGREFRERMLTCLGCKDPQHNETLRRLGPLSPRVHSERNARLFLGRAGSNRDRRVGMSERLYSKPRRQRLSGSRTGQ